jgi:hypothetical protein
MAWPLKRIRHLEIVGSGVEVLFCDMSDVRGAMSRFSPADTANMNELGGASIEIVAGVQFHNCARFPTTPPLTHGIIKSITD